jgi:hypothetical protein
VPSPSVTSVSPPPASPVPGRRGGGGQIKIALKDDVTQNTAVVTLPGSLPELLQVSALSPSHTHTHTYTHMYTHTYTHTHTHLQRCLEN